MTSRSFNVAYPARVQVSRLGKAEKDALARLFSSRDQLHSPEVTRKLDGGRYISRVLTKRVLWSEISGRKPEVLSVVDQSYARGA